MPTLKFVGALLLLYFAKANTQGYGYYPYRHYGYDEANDPAPGDDEYFPVDGGYYPYRYYGYMYDEANDPAPGDDEYFSENEDDEFFLTKADDELQETSDDYPPPEADDEYWPMPIYDDYWPMYRGRRRWGGHQHLREGTDDLDIGFNGDAFKKETKNDRNNPHGIFNLPFVPIKTPNSTQNQNGGTVNHQTFYIPNGVFMQKLFTPIFKGSINFEVIPVPNDSNTPPQELNLPSVPYPPVDGSPPIDFYPPPPNVRPPIDFYPPPPNVRPPIDFYPPPPNVRPPIDFYPPPPNVRPPIESYPHGDGSTHTDYPPINPDQENRTPDHYPPAGYPPPIKHEHRDPFDWPNRPPIHSGGVRPPSHIPHERYPEVEWIDYPYPPNRYPSDPYWYPPPTHNIIGPMDFQPRPEHVKPMDLPELTVIVDGNGKIIPQPRKSNSGKHKGTAGTLRYDAVKLENLQHQDAPMPENDEPALMRGYDEPAPMPEYDEPALMPEHDESTSMPGYDEPASMPEYDEPAVMPGYDEPALMPEYDEPVPMPVYDKPAPMPVYDKAAPVPVFNESAHMQVYTESALMPKYDEPAPMPVYDEPAPIPVNDKPASNPEHDAIKNEPALRSSFFEIKHLPASQPSYIDINHLPAPMPAYYPNKDQPVYGANEKSQEPSTEVRFLTPSMPTYYPNKDQPALRQDYYSYNYPQAPMPTYYPNKDQPVSKPEYIANKDEPVYDANEKLQEPSTEVRFLTPKLLTLKKKRQLFYGDTEAGQKVAANSGMPELEINSV